MGIVLQQRLPCFETLAYLLSQNEQILNGLQVLMVSHGVSGVDIIGPSCRLLSICNRYVATE